MQERIRKTRLLRPGAEGMAGAAPAKAFAGGSADTRADIDRFLAFLEKWNHGENLKWFRAARANLVPVATNGFAASSSIARQAARRLDGETPKSARTTSAAKLA